MVSVLIPARGRMDLLSQMVKSYQETSSGESELLFRTDLDDPLTSEYLRDYKFTVLEGQRVGYQGIHQMYNELLPFAKGDFIQCGNDDMIFSTLGWDSLISQKNPFKDGIYLLECKTPGWPVFPFTTLPRKAPEILGYIYPEGFLYGDRVMYKIMESLGRVVNCPEIEFKHTFQSFPHIIASSQLKFGSPEYTKRSKASVQHAIDLLSRSKE